MHVLSIIRNNRGAGMLMAGLALAALGAAGFMVAEMFMKSDEVLMKDTRTLAYRHLVDSVRRNLYSGNTCTKALGSAMGSGRSVASAIGIPVTAKGPAGQPITMTMRLGLDDVNLEPGMKFPTGTSIKNVYLQKYKDGRFNDDIRLHPGTGAPAVLKAGYFNLIIEPDHKGLNVWNKDASGKYVNEEVFVKIFAYYDPTNNQIYSCFDPASDAAYCTEIQKGAYFHDPATPPELRCQPDRVCFDYKGGILSPGEICPLPFTVTPVGGGGNAYPAPAGGSTPAGIKMCQWCHPIPRPYSAADLAMFGLTADGGDVEGTCSSTGYTGESSLDSYQMYADGIDSSYFAGAGSSQDPTLAATAAACSSQNQTCTDDPRYSPSGDVLAYGPYYDGAGNRLYNGGIDNNRCIDDCSHAAKNNHAIGCNNGSTCPLDIIGPGDPNDCIDECTGATKSNWQGCDDVCSPQDECCVDDPSTPCEDECTGAVTCYL